MLVEWIEKRPIPEVTISVGSFHVKSLTPEKQLNHLPDSFQHN